MRVNSVVRPTTESVQVRSRVHPSLIGPLSGVSVVGEVRTGFERSPLSGERTWRRTMRVWVTPRYRCEGRHLVLVV